MLVPVAGVGRVAVAVVDVVEVVAVLDGVVAASRPVLVFVLGVGHAPARPGALVPVTVVFGVDVAIVEVVDVIAVLHAGVAAVDALLVIVSGVHVVVRGRAHLFLRWWVSDRVGSLTWANASSTMWATWWSTSR